MKIYLGSDHRGFELKKILIDYLKKENIDHEDLGPFVYKSTDDFVDYSVTVAQAVSLANENDVRGILLCGSGLGVCMVANKFKGIRAATVWSAELASISRIHDASNILCLPADFLTPARAKKIVDIWLHTRVGSALRRKRRFEKIVELDNKDGI